MKSPSTMHARGSTGITTQRAKERGWSHFGKRNSRTNPGIPLQLFWSMEKKRYLSNLYIPVQFIYIDICSSIFSILFEESLIKKHRIWMISGRCEWKWSKIETVMDRVWWHCLQCSESYPERAQRVQSSGTACSEWALEFQGREEGNNCRGGELYFRAAEDKQLVAVYRLKLWHVSHLEVLT